MQAYKYRLYPTPTQEAELRRQLALCCEVHNAALEQRIDWWRRHEIILHSRGSWHPQRGRNPKLSQTRQLQEARKELEGVKMPAQVQNEVLNRLDQSFNAFRRRRRAGLPGGYPRFRSPEEWRTLAYPSYGMSHRWLGGEGRYGRLRLVGIGDVKVRVHRPLPNADLGMATVTLNKAGWWTTSIWVRDYVYEPLPKTGKRVGINRGIRHLLATSDGRLVDGINLRLKRAPEIASAQRALARTQRGSAGWEKARQRLVRIYHRISAERERLLGELARELTREYDVIAIEDFDTFQMMQNASRHPGRFGDRISEQGWLLLEQRLRERCKRHGRTLVVVDPKGLSQLCPRCGHETPRRNDRRTFLCHGCDYKEDRDIATAKMVLRRIDDPEMVQEYYDPERLEDHA